MQYFKPEAEDRFVGDCMPFFHEGVYHLFWLLDEGHHHARGGLGCHQWAHSTTTDLLQWEHHGLAIPITDEREGSICTGSVLWHEGVYYAYYATRFPDRTEHLSLATSTDGFHFEKQEPNPFASPGPEYTASFRDPHVFRDPATGRFHMLVTTSLRGPALAGKGGCLAQLVSEDLREWRPAEPFVLPGLPGDPECPEAFEWNGRYYLVFSNEGIARYRMAWSPLGPWQTPRVDTFDGPMARVMKSAAFTGGRRIGAAFLPSLEGDRDEGAWLYAGNAVFRELVQHRDGTLGTTWPAEMLPPHAGLVPVTFRPLTDGVTLGQAHVGLAAPSSFAAACAEDLPQDFRVRMTVDPRAAACGLCVRGSGRFERGYEIRVSPHRGRVEIRPPQLGEITDNAKRAIEGVEGLGSPFVLEVLAKGDILDVCVDNRRTLVARCPEQRGDRLFLFAHGGEAAFWDLTVHRLR